MLREQRRERHELQRVDRGAAQAVVAGLDPTIAKVLLLCVIAVFCVMILVLVDRYRLELLRNECEELGFQIESRGSQGGSNPLDRNDPALGKAGR